MRQLKFNGSARLEPDYGNPAEVARRVAAAILFLALGFMLGSPPGARAGMIGSYDVSLWTLTNISADGSAAPTPVGAVITGGNSGSGNPGTTDFRIQAAGTGLVSFSFQYFSLDDPTFDYAGYLHGPNFFFLADTSGDNGFKSFSVTAGESFGFRVGTADNQFEPGRLFIFDFDAPASTGGTAVPEPATAVLFLAGIALAVRVRLKPHLTGSGRTKS